MPALRGSAARSRAQAGDDRQCRRGEEHAAARARASRRATRTRVRRTSSSERSPLPSNADGSAAIVAIDGSSAACEGREIPSLGGSAERRKHPSGGCMTRTSGHDECVIVELPRPIAAAHRARRRVARGLVGAALLAATAGSAKAGLIQSLTGGNCGTNLPVFAPWGDYSLYYFAPNGGFESGSDGWTLGGGAAVVSQGNEPWYLGGAGSHALQIPAGGTASISVCYGLAYPGCALLRLRRRGARDDPRPGRLPQPARRRLDPRRRQLHRGQSLGAVAEDLDALQRTRLARRHEDDGASVLRRIRALRRSTICSSIRSR